MQPTEGADELVAWPDVKMVRIRQGDLTAYTFQVEARQSALDRSLRRDVHEHRSLYRAPGGHELAPAGVSAFGKNSEHPMLPLYFTELCGKAEKGTDLLLETMMEQLLENPVIKAKSNCMA